MKDSDIDKCWQVRICINATSSLIVWVSRWKRNSDDEQVSKNNS